MTPPPPAQRCFTREGVRAVDQACVERYGLPSVVLMENSAAALRDAALRLLEDRAGPVLIVCGPGNNGGDGFALARRLHNDGIPVAVRTVAPFDRYDGDAKTNLDVALRMELGVEPMSKGEVAHALDAVAEPALVIDALLGTGLTSPVRGGAEEAVRWINAQRAPVLAVDIPTGLDCDTGEPLGGPDGAVRAALTVSFCGPKVGFRNPSSRGFTGEVVVGDIGAPRELLERFGEAASG